jgi:uncharacterized protein YeeX (DUF496 family)
MAKMAREIIDKNAEIHNNKKEIEHLHNKIEKILFIMVKMASETIALEKRVEELEKK